jgi:hypothetical protein
VVHAHLNVVAEEPADSVVAPAPRPEQQSNGKVTAAGGAGNASGGADNATGGEEERHWRDVQPEPEVT